MLTISTSAETRLAHSDKVLHVKTKNKKLHAINNRKNGSTTVHNPNLWILAYVVSLYALSGSQAPLWHSADFHTADLQNTFILNMGILDFFLVLFEIEKNVLRIFTALFISENSAIIFHHYSFKQTLF